MALKILYWVRVPFFLLGSLSKQRNKQKSLCPSLQLYKSSSLKMFMTFIFLANYPKHGRLDQVKTVVCFSIPFCQGPRLKNELLRWCLVICSRISFLSDQVGLGVPTATKNHLEVEDTPGSVCPHSGTCYWLMCGSHRIWNLGQWRGTSSSWVCVPRSPCLR